MKAKARRPKRRLVASLTLLAVLGLYAGLCLLLPIGSLGATLPTTTLSITAPPSNLPWPKYGEGAVGLSDGSLIQTHGNQTPLPTASVAKLITALAVLKKYPLAPGQSGPTITLDATDYSFYTKYLAEQGSVVPISPGEQFSELSMLEAMLIPSGNNIADSLARWAYGSLAAYDSYANTFVKQLGLNSTTVGSDASGYLPDSVSTASDLIKLGSLVINNPLLKQIVAMTSASIPGIGTVNNFDNILGTAGINGIKTGNSNQAGGVFLASATTKVNDGSITILVALMSAPNLAQVLSDTVPMVIAVENDFGETILVNQGEVLGEFRQPWGGIIQVTAQSDLLKYVLQGQTALAKLNITPLKIPSLAGSRVGTITTSADQYNSVSRVQVITAQPTTSPSWRWRLLHPESVF